MGDPLYRWMVYFMENPNLKWIITRGTLSWKKELRMFCWKGIRYSNSHSPNHHFCRWYGYHSQSWVVHGIVLPTLPSSKLT